MGRRMSSKRSSSLSCFGPVIYVAVMLGIVYGMFCLHRWFNWKMYYEGKVRQEIEKYHEEQKEKANEDTTRNSDG